MNDYLGNVSKGRPQDELRIDDEEALKNIRETKPHPPLHKLTLKSNLDCVKKRADALNNQNHLYNFIEIKKFLGICECQSETFRSRESNNFQLTLSPLLLTARRWSSRAKVWQTRTRSMHPPLIVKSTCWRIKLWPQQASHWTVWTRSA